MAFGLAGASGSFQANMSIVGGIVTGSKGEFLALPISSTVLGGLSGLDSNEWSQFYLSDSFGAASASVVQALNFLKTTADAGGGDVSGPASSNDNAIVRFDGTGGKTVQNTSQILISDAGAISSSVTAHFVDGITGKLLAVSSSISGTSLAIGGDEFTVSADGLLEGGDGGGTYKMTTDGRVSGTSALQGNSILIQSASIALEVSGGSLSIGGDDFTVSTLGAVAGGAGGDSYAFAANGALSGANSVTAGTTVVASTNVSGAGILQGGAIAVGANGSEFTMAVNGAGAGGAGGDSYSFAANGQLSSSNAVLAGTNVSGAGSILGGAVSVGNGAGVISVAGAFVGASFSGQSVNAGNIKSELGGNISASVASSVQFSNTGSAGGNNYKAAMLISSSDIQDGSDAALIPRMVLQGTDDAGALKDFMVSVSGGMLQVVELTYGNALPI